MDLVLKWARQQQKSWLTQIEHMERGHYVIFEARDGIYGKQVNITAETIADLKMRVAEVGKLIARNKKAKSD